MTDTIKFRRRRRPTVDDDLPADLAHWFEHGGSPPWSALLSPDWELLPARWARWQREHPDAQPPKGHECIVERDA